MAQVTVKGLAQVVDTLVERLLLQMRSAGPPYTSAGQVVTDSEKQALLTHPKGSRGGRTSEPRKITLQRKTTTTLKVSDSRTVSVEVHKKKTYVKRGPDKIEAERQHELEEQRAAEGAKHLKAEEAAARQCAEEEARKAKEAACVKATQEAAATAGTEPAVAADIAVAGPVVKPATVGERKEEEPRRVFKRGEGDDRRDRRRTQHRPSTKEREKVPTPRVAPRSIGEEGDGYRHGDRDGKSRLKKRSQHRFQNPTGPIAREVSTGEAITVAELVAQMLVKGAEVVKSVFKIGSPMTINQILDQETAQLVAEELGHKVKLVSENVLGEQLAESLKFKGEAITRAPVVTVTGHVDHGKTSLLNCIRRAKVAAGEAGDIAQRTGTYHVGTERGTVTFLDTPGHAVLTAMHTHGTQTTDIMILVVAIDDGAMPQTQEVVRHAKVVDVPVMVAVNKIDKPEASPDNIKNGLAALDVIPEEWGSGTPFVPVSTKLDTGVDRLLEAVLLQAEVFELKATPSVPGRGMVVESCLDKGHGPVTIMLAQDSTLRQGDMVLVGISYGRIRAMLNENGRPIRGAGPSISVEILGLDGTPNAGDEMAVVADRKKAHKAALFRQGKFREVRLARTHAGKLGNVFENMDQEEEKALSVTLKAGARNSLEVLQSSLSGLGDDEVRAHVVGGSVGDITESDANLALASNVMLLGFNVHVDAGAREIVETEGLDVHCYNVIYDIAEDVKKALTGMLGSDLRENILDIAEVRGMFHLPKFGTVAGCMVTEGMVHRNHPIRVLRDDVVIFEGEPESLHHFKDGVAEVCAGIECGIGVKGHNDIKVGDKIEVFEEVEVAHSL